MTDCIRYSAHHDAEGRISSIEVTAIKYVEDERIVVSYTILPGSVQVYAQARRQVLSVEPDSANALRIIVK
jgi:ABC-type uncharacterized transport system auxiliary subunit